MAQKALKTVAAYVHADKPFGGWKAGYFEAYAAARNAAIQFGRKSDNLWAWYLSDQLNDTDDALAVMASDMMERIAYGFWREAAYLWSEGENK